MRKQIANNRKTRHSNIDTFSETPFLTIDPAKSDIPDIASYADVDIPVFPIPLYISSFSICCVLKYKKIM